ncbi:MAG: heavy metal-binding domain-containing protein [Phycisphaeraceae bacterium]|nr:heavy metal-binding domain-containing protein [Phycisphaeraceae bacterium]
MIVQLFDVILFAAGLLVGLMFGSLNEQRHLRSLVVREASGEDVMLVNLRHVTDPETVRDAQMIVGQVVIATDYWKTFITSLRRLVGGELGAARRLMDRARREATLRLIEEARMLGAGEIWNVRYESTMISQMRDSKAGAMQVEILAWGTAVRRR